MWAPGHNYSPRRVKSILYYKIDLTNTFKGEISQIFCLVMAKKSSDLMPPVSGISRGVRYQQRK